MVVAMLDTQHGGSVLRTRSMLRASPSLDLQAHASTSGNKQLVPWPGMRFACMKILHLYCKVFGQIPLYELIVRKTCSGCKCPREAHAICHDEYQNVSERLGFKSNSGLPATATPHSFDPKVFNYSWAPPSVTTLPKIEEYYSSFPAEKIPRIGTPGERYRDRQLLTQLPKQDLALTYCKNVGSKHHNSYEDFVSARNEIALDIGYVIETPRNATVDCYACTQIIAPGRLCVTSTRFGGTENSDSDDRPTSMLGCMWHPYCFQCKECKEPLVDLAHCVYDGAIYCERHYAELLKPRCNACDEVSELPEDLGWLHTLCSPCAGCVYFRLASLNRRVLAADVTSD